MEGTLEVALCLVGRGRLACELDEVGRGEELGQCSLPGLGQAFEGFGYLRGRHVHGVDVEARREVSAECCREVDIVGFVVLLGDECIALVQGIEQCQCGFARRGRQRFDALGAAGLDAAHAQVEEHGGCDGKGSEEEEERQRAVELELGVDGTVGVAEDFGVERVDGHAGDLQAHCGAGQKGVGTDDDGRPQGVEGTVETGDGVSPEEFEACAVVVELCVDGGGTDDLDAGHHLALRGVFWKLDVASTIGLDAELKLHLLADEDGSCVKLCLNDGLRLCHEGRGEEQAQEEGEALEQAAQGCGIVLVGGEGCHIDAGAFHAVGDAAAVLGPPCDVAATLSRRTCVDEDVASGLGIAHAQKPHVGEFLLEGVVDMHGYDVVLARSDGEWQ